MLTSTSLSAYLAIPMPDQIHDELFRRYLYRMLDKLCELSGKLEFDLAKHGAYQPIIELLEKSFGDQENLERWFEAGILEKCEILKLSIEVPIAEVSSNDMDSVPSSWVTKAKDKFVELDQLTEFTTLDGLLETSIKASIVEDIQCLLIREAFCKNLCDIVIAANVACPGSLEMDKSIVVQDGLKRKQLTPMSTYALREGVTLARTIGWPKLEELEFVRVWNWMIQQRGFVDGFSNNSTSRAINAFTHLFDMRTELEPMQLLWALVGIESLYVKGKTALIEQVKEKSQVLLGPQESFKKKIGKMYEFRSRFVHGDLDIPAINSPHDLTPEIERYDKELIQSTALAIAILTATIQELVRRGWKGITFSYAISDLS